MALKLPRIARGTQYIDKDGAATQQFQLMWQRLCEKIEDEFGAIEAAEAAQAAAEAANTAAAAATAAAETAQTTADTITADNNLINSYVTGATLTGIDTGPDAKVTVSSHTRVYGDGTSLAITGADVTGLAYSTLYYIYYDDATRADTTPAFAATTSVATAAQTGNRHLVGSVTTPAAAAGNTSGNYVAPPGVGDIP